MGAELELPRGLPAACAEELAALVGQITGRAPAALPWFATVLLFAEPEVNAHLALPETGPEEMLIHDYQSVDCPALLPLDTALTARAETTSRGDLTDHRFTLCRDGAEVAKLGTALRRVKIADLIAAAPAPFRAEMLKDVTWFGPFAISQELTDRYLALSSDPNPIHRDAELAPRLGLSAPVVPGLLLLSMIQPSSEVMLGAPLATLKARFMAPLTMNTELRIGLQRRGPARLRAYLEAGSALAVADMQMSHD
ncbi:MaoC family dehydratase [Pseudoruegeria sp. HB172150]|uniref:MaoC family dehydratase n=1 Tax=Pseudoruegeria sp. HB172150 TaxID=2721164 RepID=UPI0015550CF1|nr:MaoC family dehydratase [Pseudoruegeria sp. HB172150]